MYHAFIRTSARPPMRASRGLALLALALALSTRGGDAAALGPAERPQFFPDLNLGGLLKDLDGAIQQFSPFAKAAPGSNNAPADAAGSVRRMWARRERHSKIHACARACRRRVAARVTLREGLSLSRRLAGPIRRTVAGGSQGKGRPDQSRLGAAGRWADRRRSVHMAPQGARTRVPVYVRGCVCACVFSSSTARWAPQLPETFLIALHTPSHAQCSAVCMRARMRR